MFSALRYLHAKGIAHRDLKVRVGPPGRPISRPAAPHIQAYQTNRHGTARRDLKLENFLFEVRLPPCPPSCNATWPSF